MEDEGVLVSVIDGDVLLFELLSLEEVSERVAAVRCHGLVGALVEVIFVATQLLLSTTLTYSRLPNTVLIITLQRKHTHHGTNFVLIHSFEISSTQPFHKGNEIANQIQMVESSFTFQAEMNEPWQSRGRKV